jgi:protein phosphatase 1 regulatory subunit 7
MASGEGAIDPQAAASGAGADAELETEEQEGPVLCLDLTSYQLHDLSEVEIPPTLEELDVTANRLSSVDPRICLLAELRKLSFRQNLLEDAAVEPLSSWATIAELQVITSLRNACTGLNFVGVLLSCCYSI